MKKRKTVRFDVLTLFPDILETYFNTSILKRAQEKGVAKMLTHQIRDYATDKHHTTDETPYGGGAGMVLKAEPILRGVEKIVKSVSAKGGKGSSSRRKILIMSAKGKPFTQKLAYDWSKKFDHFVVIAGRYEGIDERVMEILSAKGRSASDGNVEEISIGPYVTTDGDVGAMIIVSAITRLLPGAIRLESLAEESHWNQTLQQERHAKVQPVQSSSLAPQAYSSLEYPHYTRPEVFIWKGKKYRVPKVLLSGNHKEIEDWRQGKRKASR